MTADLSTRTRAQLRGIARLLNVPDQRMKTDLLLHIVAALKARRLNGLTYGELFAGYGGLGMGIQSVLGGEMLWSAEFDAAPSKILAYHWPRVPNLGDVTRIDWYSVPPVDVLTGGSPCQDLSTAGKRKGMKPGTRSGLWASMCDAIQILRPRLVVWENVRGALSAEAEADSDMEPCPFCVGDDSGAALRALGRVLGDLAELGYDAQWYGFPASDVGACHGRFRVFVFAWPREKADPGDLLELADTLTVEGPPPGPVARLFPTPKATNNENRPGESWSLNLGQTIKSFLPTPAVANRPVNAREDYRFNLPEAIGYLTEGRDRPPAGRDRALQVEALLPTPAVNDMGDGKTPEQWDAWNDGPTMAHQRHGESLAIAAQRLFKTPTSNLGSNGGSQHPDKRRAGGHGPTLQDEVEKLLPTPIKADGEGGRTKSFGKDEGNLPQAARLLATPSTSTSGPGRPERFEARSEGQMYDLQDQIESVSRQQDWRAYEGAIRRQEVTFGRPAPLPVERSKAFRRRQAGKDKRLVGMRGSLANTWVLSPVFVEWMMGLPEGHVTDPGIGISREDQLKALGNGVIPQQSAAATRWYLADVSAEHGKRAAS